MASLREQAEAIWQAGVSSVHPEPLVASQINLCDGHWIIGPLEIPCADFLGQSPSRIEVLGAGKAGAAMAAGFEKALLDQGFPSALLSGWLNVPASEDLPALQRIYLHPARPLGKNEPTVQAMAGAQEILKRANALRPHDLCVVLLSGGGSALLPAPRENISLGDKLQVTRWLSAAGADIEQLNAVRTCLSEIKGGGLARACRASQMIVFVISDVLGDPLPVIASGPCVMDIESQPQHALRILHRFDPRRQLPSSIYQLLEQTSQSGIGRDAEVNHPEVFHEVIGNNAAAVDAAGIKADEMGWKPAMISATKCEGSAAAVGFHLADMIQSMLRGEGPDCLISGGEPTVELPNEAGTGGRNQQVVLSTAIELLRRDVPESEWKRICFLSAGTDGEDGPTDAAGGVVDEAVLRAIADQPDVAMSHLNRCDAYPFLQKVHALIRTGATGTNVCDLRVVLVQSAQGA